MAGYTLGADSRSCSGKQFVDLIRHFISYMLDINECATNNGGCSQNCTNTFGSFVCSCMAGYTLGADSRSCNGTYVICSPSIQNAL